MKKPRPRLKAGDRVKVVKVPKAYKRWLGRVGRVFGVRGLRDKMWQVRFGGNSGCSEFFRHELVKVEK